MGRIERELAKSGARVNQLGDAFARGEALLLVLIFNRLDTTALADLFLLIVDLRYQVSHGAHIFFESRRGGVDLRLNHVARR